MTVMTNSGRDLPRPLRGGWGEALSLASAFIALAPHAARAQIAPDIFLQTTQTFSSWTSNCQQSLVTCDGPGVVCDPVNLLGSDPAFGGFCNQIQANTHAFVTSGNDLYLFSYGDSNLDDMTPEGSELGDSIHNMLRVSPGGAYQIEATAGCAIPPDPRLFFPRINGIRWGDNGWMGVGATIFKPRSGLNFCGFQYFSLVWLADSGPNHKANSKLADCHWPDPAYCSNPSDPSTCYGILGNESTRCDDTFKLAWAMSSNGNDWYFDRNGSGAGCDNSPIDVNTVMTTDPKLAQPVVSRALWYPFAGSQKTDGPFFHLAGFFSDSTLSGQNGPGDDKYYAFTGYEHPCGISLISFRIKVDPAWPTSRGNIELYDRVFDNYFPPDYPASCTTCPSPGVCSPADTNDICESCQDMTGRVTSVCSPADPRRLCFPIENACPWFCPPRHQIIPRNRYADFVDVHDVVVLRKANGTFYSLLMAYESSDTFLTGRITVRQSKNIKAPFDWSERRDLEVCKLASDGFVDCGAGFFGWPVAFVQPPQSTFPSFYDSTTGVPTKILGYFVGRKTALQCGGSDPVVACRGGSQGLIPAVISLVSGPQIPPVTNLKLKKTESSNVQFCWDMTSPTHRYRLVQGTLASLGSGAYDHHRFSVVSAQSTDPQQECDVIFLSGSGIVATKAPTAQVPGDSYWIVVPVCDGESEGSYGTNSAGIPRPIAIGGCRSGSVPSLSLTNGACQ